MRLIRLAVLALALVSVALADKVTLKDGRAYEGVILEDTDTTIKIRTSRATLSFAKDQVASIEKGSGALDERERRLTALDPAKPGDYLETAAWMTAKGRETFDIATFRTLCNAAAKLDSTRAYEAQMLLGRELDKAGDRKAAAAAYGRALVAKKGDREAEILLGALKTSLEADAKVEITALRDALIPLTTGDLELAVTRLRRCGANAFSENAVKYVGVGFDVFVKNVASRIMCKPCEGKGLINCPQCESTCIVKCSTCLGTGKKAAFKAGKNPDTEFADNVCRSCFGVKSILCTKCKAERIVLIRARGRDETKAKVTCGHEMTDIAAHINMTKYQFPSGHFVNEIVGGEILTNGKTPCGTCQGIPYAPPITALDTTAVQAYADAASAVLAGTAQYEVIKPENNAWDPAAIPEGSLKYKNGKWR